VPARRPRTVAFLLIPPVPDLDLVGPLEVFTGANRVVGERRAPYSLRIVSPRTPEHKENGDDHRSCRHQDEHGLEIRAQDLASIPPTLSRMSDDVRHPIKRKKGYRSAAARKNRLAPSRIRRRSCSSVNARATANVPAILENSAIVFPRRSSSFLAGRIGPSG
jgi:hypothetical protein